MVIIEIKSSPSEFLATLQTELRATQLILLSDTAVQYTDGTSVLLMAKHPHKFCTTGGGLGHSAPSSPPQYCLAIHDRDVKSLARPSDLEFLFPLSKTVHQHRKNKIKVVAVAVSPPLMTSKSSDLMPTVEKDFKRVLKKPEGWERSAFHHQIQLRGDP